MLDLIRRANPSLLLAQEVTPGAFAAFGSLFDWGAYSLDLWDSPPCDHSPNGRGVAVLGRDRSVLLRDRYLVDHLIAPFKMLAVDLAVSGRRGYFTAASYHALHGDKGRDGLDKPRLSLQVADWLEHQPQPVVLGMDANSPDVDHPDRSKIRCHFRWLGPGSFEERLLGPAPRHRLRDTLRAYLEAHPDAYAQVCAERPAGPLAVSHTTRGNPGLFRYDHIYASWPDFHVTSAEYLYREARDAGSDHALVLTDLQATTGTGTKGETDLLHATPLMNRPVATTVGDRQYS